MRAVTKWFVVGATTAAKEVNSRQMIARVSAALSLQSMFLKWWLTAYQQAHSPKRLLAMNFWIGLPEMGIRPSLATQEIVFSRGDYPTKALLTRALDELTKEKVQKGKSTRQGLDTN